MEMGFLAMMGKLQYHQYTTSDAARFNDAQTSMIYEYEGNVSFGFNGYRSVQNSAKIWRYLLSLLLHIKISVPHSVKEHIIFKEEKIRWL